MVKREIEDFTTDFGFKDNDNWYQSLVYFKPCHIAIDVLHQCFEGLFFLKNFLNYKLK
jgi:hypothetical protein